MALVDPRGENPLDLIELDITDTFFFVEAGDEGTEEYIRATYTIEVLALNVRDHLVRSRRAHFAAFRGILVDYIQRRDQRLPQSELDLLKNDLLALPHQTVWLEMKRQHSDHLELKQLFGQAPEALAW